MVRPDGDHIKSQRVPNYKGLPKGLVPEKSEKVKIYEFIKSNKKIIPMRLLYKNFAVNEGTIRRYIREMEGGGFVGSRPCECSNSKMVFIIEK